MVHGPQQMCSKMFRANSQTRFSAKGLHAPPQLKNSACPAPAVHFSAEMVVGRRWVAILPRAVRWRYPSWMRKGS